MKYKVGDIAISQTGKKWNEIIEVRANSYIIKNIKHPNPNQWVNRKLEIYPDKVEEFERITRLLTPP